jgi:hypothetical protein
MLSEIPLAIWFDLERWRAGWLKMLDVRASGSRHGGGLWRQWTLEMVRCSGWGRQLRRGGLQADPQTWYVQWPVGVPHPLMQPWPGYFGQVLD